MQRAGWFRELGVGDGAPSIQQHLSPVAGDRPELAASYLERATEVLVTPTVTRDELDPARPIICGRAILTDGAWIWPAGLAHYVRRHHLRLPDELVDRMRAHGWEPPVPDDDATAAATAAAASALGLEAVSADL
jgi:hypothetical protein